ncbi:MAG: tetratricopeptide repeat protein [Cyanobacteria bacterium HKST-UBA01]|nr:tetratricopeptide repeat protein [Cyanobacteria bacterium HKST-UBA01]
MGLKEKVQIGILVFALVALAPELIALGYQRVSWSEYSDRGRQLITFGEPQEAITYFEAESREAFKDKGPKSPEYIATLEGLSRSMAREKLYQGAEEKLDKALAIMQSFFFKDRQKITHLLEMKIALLKEQDSAAHGKEIAVLKEEIRSLNAWWQWLWTGFFIAFIAEALYMANVIAKPGDMQPSHFLVDHGYLYVFSILVGTATMTKGLLLWGGITWLQAMFAGPGISLALLPLVFGGVMASSELWVREDPLAHLKPSRQAYR